MTGDNMRFLGEISSMTSDLNQPENHFQDISRTCRKVIGEVKHGHNPKTSISALLYFGLKDIARYWKVLQRSIVVWAPTGLPLSSTGRLAEQ